MEGEREWGGRRERATDFVLHLPMSIFLCCQPLPTKFEPSHIIHPFVLIVVDRRAILGKRVKQDQGGKEVELEIDRSSRRTGRTFRSVCVEGCTLTYFVPRPAGSSLSDGSRVANGGRREGGGGGGDVRETPWLGVSQGEGSRTDSEGFSPNILDSGLREVVAK